MSGSTEASGGFEVPTPILNSPFEPPAEYWDLREGEPPQRLQGRRPAGYYYRDPRAGVQGAGGSRGVSREMPLVNTIRGRLRPSGPDMAEKRRECKAQGRRANRPAPAGNVRPAPWRGRVWPTPVHVVGCAPPM